MSDITRGQFVISKAGRDKGQCYIVIGFDKPFAYLVDGSSRRLEKPKKKKERHIQLTHYIDERIQGLLDSESKLLNEDIRNSIKEFIEKDDNSAL